MKGKIQNYQQRYLVRVERAWVKDRRANLHLIKLSEVFRVGPKSYPFLLTSNLQTSLTTIPACLEHTQRNLRVVYDKGQQLEKREKELLEKMTTLDKSWEAKNEQVEITQKEAATAKKEMMNIWTEMRKTKDAKVNQRKGDDDALSSQFKKIKYF